MSREQIEQTAARWLLRREEPGWSQQEQAELDQWLDADPAHEAALWRLEHGAGKLDRLVALGGTGMTTAQAAAPRRPSRLWWGAAGTALAACLALAVVAVPQNRLAAPRVYATEVGGREELPLADGTRVELNTATRLRAQIGKSRRIVWLDQGEAYFEVAHDSAHPFVVQAGPKTVTVLGTKFSVRRDGDRVQVAVLEGRVRVEDTAAAAGRAAVITRGDIAVADAASTLVAPRSMERVTDELSWRDGRLRFRETTLAEAAAEFNRYNRTRLVIADARAASTQIGGNFDPRKVQDFTRLLEQAYGFRVEREGQVLKISSPS